MNRCSLSILRKAVAYVVIPAFSVLAARSQAEAPSSMATPGAQARDLSTPTVYLVSTAHLDTNWLWTIQDTIREYIPNTMRENLELMAKYPDYKFNFEGSFHYELMKEYYPQDYARVKQAIADGRWSVCGSWVNAVDSNIPAPESLVRQTLYGNGFFEKEFGKTSTDIYLPDCFGFSSVLPTIATHCGLTGFSTQKLTWGSSVGIPFRVGKWQGIDGSTIFAALDPGDYTTQVTTDLSHDPKLLERTTKQKAESNLAVDFRYYGVGDRGGAPSPESAGWAVKSTHGDGPVRINLTSADQLFRDLSLQDTSKLPVYSGELLMTVHGTGCYTSQAAMKRWNRQNERYGAMAESAALTADYLGLVPYPAQTLTDNWKRVLWHQFHDDITGTSLTHIYRWSWNDELLAQNVFSGVFDDAATAVIGQMDTSWAAGIPLVVHNALPFERVTTVQAVVDLGRNAGSSFVAVLPDGTQAPVTILQQDGSRAWVSFVARVAPEGFTVVDLRKAHAAPAVAAATPVLESDLLRVSVDAHGQIASIVDKKANRELLRAPIALQFLTDDSRQYPAWELLYKDVSSTPVNVPQTHVAVDPQPGRIHVTRTLGNSIITQDLTLSADGSRVEVDTTIDWNTRTSMLKAAFQLTASNEEAQYDVGLGTIARPTNTPKKYEVPAQLFAALPDASGKFGVAILSDSRGGWDKPSADTLRLTLVHSPEKTSDWSTIDIGRHQLRYAITPYTPGDFAEVYRQAQDFAQPAVAFQTRSHDGALGKTFSMLRVNNPGARVLAFKKAEDGNGMIVRLCNVSGNEIKNCIVGLPGLIHAVTELSGTEKELANHITPQGREFQVDLKPYQLRTFRIDLPHQSLRGQPSQSVALKMDQRLTAPSPNSRAMDSTGKYVPTELWPSQISASGVTFITAGAETANALSCQGQSISLPAGRWDSVHILAAATEPVDTLFTLNGKRELPVHVSSFTGLIGQWFSRMVEGKHVVAPVNLSPAFYNPDRVAYTFTHLKNADGSNTLYDFGHLFAYDLRDGRGIETITLPNDPRVKIVAMTASRQSDHDTTLVTPLVDHTTAVRIDADSTWFGDSTTVRLSSTIANLPIHYTLDGSEPTAESPQYTAPITITQSCTLRAVALQLPRSAMDIATMDLVKVPSLPAVADARTSKKGLSYRYFEGDFKTTSDIPTQTVPTAQGDVSHFTLSPQKRNEHFGMVFEGYIQIPTTGAYRFSTLSDDGSRLWIDDRLIVDNDGPHGEVEVGNVTVLNAGLHRVRAAYCQGVGGSRLDVFWESSAFTRQPVPAGILSH